MERPIPLKTSAEVASIREACAAAVAVLERVREMVAPGVSTLTLDQAARQLMGSLGARPAVPPGFPGAICTSVNEVAAHGVPSDCQLREGDLVTVDVSLELNGWCGDAARTYGVGSLDEGPLRLLTAARRALAAGTAAVRAGGHLGDVGASIAQEAARHRCVVIPELVGHGIGRRLHEEPEVAHTGRPGEGQRIVPGMVLTVEPVLTLGSGRIDARGDGWSLVAADGAPVAQFEHTVAVFLRRTEVLTGGAEGPELSGQLP
ncbi:MAG: type I methionyl aminopeptidase [Spirochaetales bacterium]|nr:type I methionyl aminopeptidase [Spirochaetales bacterium]